MTRRVPRSLWVIETNKGGRWYATGRTGQTRGIARISLRMLRQFAPDIKYRIAKYVPEPDPIEEIRKKMIQDRCICGHPRSWHHSGLCSNWRCYCEQFILLHEGNYARRDVGTGSKGDC